MLFDEPTTGLDPITANLIHRLISCLHERLRFTGSSSAMRSQDL